MSSSSSSSQQQPPLRLQDVDAILKQWTEENTASTPSARPIESHKSLPSVKEFLMGLIDTRMPVPTLVKAHDPKFIKLCIISKAIFVELYFEEDKVTVHAPFMECIYSGEDRLERLIKNIKSDFIIKKNGKAATTTF